MKWILFTGTWRLTNTQVETDVRNAVRDVIGRGDGILTGGATGVDYFAMDEALKIQPDGSRLKVIIPAYLDYYIDDYRKNWCQSPITQKDIDNLEFILRRIKKLHPDGIAEMPYQTITQDHYFLRDSEEVKIADEVFAFQVNKSAGTQDTIDKAKAAGVPIAQHKQYSL
ncbi:MAG: hypothetical protein WCG07_02645 [Candidatus Taylorbacteria bacterium]